MSRVALYDAQTTKAKSKTNGLGLIQAINAVVVEELLDAETSAQYRAKVIVPISDPLISEVKVGAIMRLSTPEGPDWFRIVKTQKTLDAVVAEAWHITYDLRNLLIRDRAWIDQPLVNAWPDIIQAGGATEFTGTSDISDVRSLRIVRRSVLEALIGDQPNSVINRWGGELFRHGWNIDMLKHRGEDRGVQIRYGKNLLGINDEVDTSDVFHAVLPSYQSSDQTVLMDEIRAPGYETITNPRTVAIHFSDVLVGDQEGEFPTDTAAQQEIVKRINDMWLAGANRPRANCQIQFVDLRKTEQYKELAPLEEVRLGDTVRAVWEGHVDITQRVIRYEWDALDEKFTSIELGDPARNINNIKAQISEIVAEQVDEIMPSRLDHLVEATFALNETIINASGYYKTEITNEATGAKKTYIHDAPLLEDSTFIATMAETGTYAWTDTGWNDGSPQWKYGVTKDGNMLIKYIAAVGIAAEWIILESGDDAQTVITQLQAGQLTISDQLAVGGENLLRNPTFGTPHLAEKTGWSTGEIMQLCLARFKGKTMSEMLTTLEGKTINDLINYNY